MRRHLPPLLLLLAAVPIAELPAQAPTPTPTPAPAPRIGVFFWHDSPNDLVTYAGIQQGLRQAGIAATFVEQRAGADRERAQTALAALQAARCDLVLAMGTQSALLAKDALREVPIVFAAVSDPVAAGVVPSWAGSGTNLCGASNWIAPANVVMVFALAVPHLRRLGVLRSADASVVSRAELQTMREHLAADPGRGIALCEAVARDADDIPRALGELLAQDVDALWIPIDITIYQHLGAVQRTLGERRLPMLTTAAAAVRQGAVAAAIADYELHGRRAAALAVRVLRGARPGAQPVDRMSGGLVVVNLRTARELGIELPLSLLVLADELIDREARYDDR